MGTPLTGSSVASTYTGLLKNTDNSTVGATLKAISDGSGNDSALQISSVAVNTTNDFSVATNKLTVASASGNTAVAGTLAVTGATNLSSLITSGAATIGGALNVTGATTLTGNLTVPGNLAVTGTSTLTGATAVTGTLGVTGVSTLASVGVTGAATVGTTLGVTGVSTLASAVVTGAATVGTTLGVTGAATVGTTLGVTGNATLAANLTVNGDTTLGSAPADLVVILSDQITVPNILSATIDLAADKVLITDANDSSKVKAVAASSLGISATTAPQVKQTLYQDSTAGGSPFVATSAGSGTEITVLTTSITPRSIASTVLVTIVVNYSGTNINYGAFRITRNGTEIGSNNIGSSLYGIAPFTGIGPYSSEFFNSQFIQILDSPSSASAVTYKIHLYATGATFPSMWVNKTYQDVLSGTNSSSAARVSSSMILQEYFA
jgi:hypothetical protein